MDQGQVTGAVFIDFRKAFDSVNHLRVLKKLYALSIVDQEQVWSGLLTVLKIELRSFGSRQTLNLS